MFRKTFNKGESCVALAKHGFSLVELLVVITIIAIMSVAAYTAVGGQTVKAKNSRRTQDISTIQQALELYYVEKGVYPNALAVPLVHANFYTFATTLDSKYISKTPVDPWSTDTLQIPYSYNINGTKKQYQLAASLEGETANKAYVVGNSAVPLIKSASNDDVLDGGAVLPYEQP